MTHTDTDTAEKLYAFRGTTFLAHPSTIKQLNYALALNRVNERYVEASPKKEKKNVN